jgi:hypothetical protein
LPIKDTKDTRDAIASFGGDFFIGGGEKILVQEDRLTVGQVGQEMPPEYYDRSK